MRCFKSEHPRPTQLSKARWEEGQSFRDVSSPSNLIVATDPISAFSQLQSYISEEGIEDDATRAVAREVLRFFGPSTYSREGPGWYLPEIPVLLREDSRWVERRDSPSSPPGDGAPRATPARDPHARRGRKRAVRRWPDPPPRPASTHAGRCDFLARYEQGDHVAVWRELFALGQPADDALRREAAAVARSTMQRVRGRTSRSGNVPV